ncbi:MAG: hypothetical protein IRY87_07095 [Acetobacteraceae bacterium]|nr:hypothetical protein [Acetobacteraceae bacterium]
MKRWLADLLIRLLRNFVEQVLTALLLWLLEALKAKLHECWQARHDRKRAEQEEAARERQRAEAAGDSEAARAAAAREAAAVRDANLIREMAEATKQVIESIALEVPKAVSEAVAAAADQSQKAIAQISG